jgi:hypothetical protein
MLLLLIAGNKKYDIAVKQNNMPFILNFVNISQNLVGWLAKFHGATYRKTPASVV